MSKKDAPWPRDLWLDAMWEREDLRPNDRAVAYAFARYAGRNEITFCPYSELQRRTGCGKDAAIAAVRRLTSAGWLTVETEAHQNYATRFRLTIPEALSRRNSRPLDTVSGGNPRPLSDSQGSDFPDSAVGISVARGRNSRPDYSETTQKDDSPKRRRSIDEANAYVAGKLDCTPDRAAAVVARVLAGYEQKHPGDRIESPRSYIAKVDDADLRALLPAPAPVELGPVCGECEAEPGDGDYAAARHLRDGSKCPRCHPAYLTGSRRAS